MLFHAHLPTHGSSDINLLATSLTVPLLLVCVALASGIYTSFNTSTSEEVEVLSDIQPLSWCSCICHILGKGQTGVPTLGLDLQKC